MFLRQAPRDYARDRQDRLTLRRTVQVRLRTNPAVPRDGCQVAHPSSSRSLRSAQSRKRVPSFVVSRQQFMKYPD
ncbi:MAG: hypothetical protein OEV22_14335 [Deltaproteobacteria bacterium]|nr:hypothetical protein [Deltaproteobacteria bacterium]